MIIGLEMKNCSMISTEKLQKCQHYHLEKTNKYEYLVDKELLPSNRSEIID